MTTKEEIKEWLKSHKKNYNWLAKQLGITPTAVRNMFAKNGAVSSRAIILIETLMNKRNFSMSVEFAVELSLKLTTDDYLLFVNLAKEAGMTTEEWVKYALAYAGEHPEVIDEIIRQEQGKENSKG